MDKHVLIIPSWYVNSYNQISGSFFREQAIALAKNPKLKVGLISVQPIGIKPIIKTKKFIFRRGYLLDNNVHTYFFEYPHLLRNESIAESIRLNIFKKIFKKYVNENGLPDIVHLHSFYAGEMAIWLKGVFKIPYVVTEHSTAFSRQILTYKQKELAEKVFTQSKLNIAVSHQFKNLLEQLFNINFYYLPNIVDNYFLNLNPKQKLECSSNFIFINIGFLDKKKNQSLLINSFYKSFFTNKNIKLWIVGDGPEYSNLKKLIEELKLSDQVTLIGRVSRDKVKVLLSKSNAFVLSSQVETFGVVIIEALAMGLPVIATKCGGPESIITNKNLGLLVENDDEEAMYRALKQIFVNYKDFDRNFLIEYVKSNFSEQTIVLKLISIYSGILD